MHVGEDGRPVNQPRPRPRRQRIPPPARHSGCAALLAAGDTLEDSPIPTTNEPAATWRSTATKQASCAKNSPCHATPNPPAGQRPSSRQDDHWIAHHRYIDHRGSRRTGTALPIQVSRKIQAIDPTLDDDLAQWPKPSIVTGHDSASSEPHASASDPAATPQPPPNAGPTTPEIVSHGATANGAIFTEEVATGGMCDRLDRVRKDCERCSTGSKTTPGTATTSSPTPPTTTKQLTRSSASPSKTSSSMQTCSAPPLRAEARGTDGLRSTSRSPATGSRALPTKTSESEDAPGSPTADRPVPLRDRRRRPPPSPALRSGQTWRRFQRRRRASPSSSHPTKPCQHLTSQSPAVPRRDEEGRRTGQISSSTGRDGSGDALIELP